MNTSPLFKNINNHLKMIKVLLLLLPSLSHQIITTISINQQHHNTMKLVRENLTIVNLLLLVNINNKLKTYFFLSREISKSPSLHLKDSPLFILETK